MLTSVRSLAVPLFLSITACGAGLAPNAPDTAAPLSVSAPEAESADGAACRLDAEAAATRVRAARLVVLARLEARPGTVPGADAPETFDEAARRAKARMTEDGSDRARGSNAPHTVLETLKGTAPARLSLPVPPCEGDLFVVMIGGGAAAAFLAVDGADDPAVAAARAAAR